MKTINVLLKLCSILIILITTGCGTTIPFPGANLKHSEICGTNRCTPGNLGTVLPLSLEARAIDQSVDIKLRQIAQDKIGRKKENNSGAMYKCGEARYIADSHIESKPPIEIKYSKISKLSGNINLMIQSNLDSISSYALSTTQIADLKAKLEALYKNVKNKSVTISAKYYEFWLNDSGIDAFRDGVYDHCLKDNGDFTIITGIGIANFEIDNVSDSMNEIGAKLTAGYSASPTFDADLKAHIKNTILKNLELKVPGTFNIIFIRSAKKKSIDTVIAHNWIFSIGHAIKPDSWNIQIEIPRLFRLSTISEFSTLNGRLNVLCPIDRNIMGFVRRFHGNKGFPVTVLSILFYIRSKIF